jgi:hypothetical protein
MRGGLLVKAGKLTAIFRARKISAFSDLFLRDSHFGNAHPMERPE